MKIFYTSVATATGDGRENGHVRSSDGVVDVEIAVPVELGGKDGATNPEQLFAAGYSACFLNALRLAVTLRVLMPKVERDRAEELVAAAHKVCPYSNATRGNIEVALTIV